MIPGAQKKTHVQILSIYKNIYTQFNQKNGNRNWHTINENRAQMRQVFLDYSLISEYLREEKNVRMVVQGDLGVKDETGLRGVIRCLCQKNKEMNSKIFANKEWSYGLVWFEPKCHGLRSKQPCWSSSLLEELTDHYHGEMGVVLHYAMYQRIVELFRRADQTRHWILVWSDAETVWDNG